MTRLALLALVATVFAASLAVAATAALRSDDPKSLSVQVARWNVLHQFARVWQTIDPRDRRATTQALWESCKEQLAPDGLRVTSIQVAASHVKSIELPPLGRVTVTVVILRSRYTLPTLNGPHTASTTIYWTHSGGRWKGLWSASDYRAYSHRRCPAR